MRSSLSRSTALDRTLVTIRRLAAFTVLAFALAGCGGSSQSSREPPVPTIATDPPTATVKTSWCLVYGTSTSPQKSSSTETLYLTDVALKSEKCVSTVSFELEPEAKVMGYDVSYQPADTAKAE